MKKLEDIKDEYEKFSTDSSKNLDEFLVYMMVGIDDLEQDEKYYKKELLDNKKWQLEAKIRNILFFLFQEEDEEFYDYDNEILEGVLVLCKTQKGLFQRILEIGNDQNYQELKKIADFAAKYYCEHMDYFEAYRDRIDACMRGFQLYTSHEDNREVVQQFLDRKMKEFDHEKVNSGRQYVKVVRSNG